MLKGGGPVEWTQKDAGTSRILSGVPHLYLTTISTHDQDNCYEMIKICQVGNWMKTYFSITEAFFIVNTYQSDQKHSSSIYL